jgi:hypothetical protein
MESVLPSSPEDGTTRAPKKTDVEQIDPPPFTEETARANVKATR